MTSFTLDRPLLATLSLLIAMLGAWTLSQEAAQYALTGTRAARVAQMPAQAPFPGLSLTTRQDALMDCVYTLQRSGSLEVRYESEAFRAGLPSQCRAMALDATATMPTYAYGWYVAAAAAAVQADWPALNDYLHRSQVTGPSSQWVAELRVELAEANRDHLEAPALSANDTDLELLVLSQRGIGSIAQRYVNDPAFRERITAIVETLPNERQSRFIAILNDLTR